MGGVIAAAAVTALLGVAPAGPPVPYSTIDSGSAGHYRAQTTIVIRDRRRYEQVWGKLQRSIPAPRRPRIDFRRKMLVAVLRGSGTGTGLELDAVTREGTGLIVNVTNTRAGAGCVVLQEVRNEYELISVSRRPGPVRTERAERVDDCA